MEWRMYLSDFFYKISFIVKFVTMKKISIWIWKYFDGHWKTKTIFLKQKSLNTFFVSMQSICICLSCFFAPKSNLSCVLTFRKIFYIRIFLSSILVVTAVSCFTFESINYILCVASTRKWYIWSMIWIQVKWWTALFSEPIQLKSTIFTQHNH